MPLVIRRKREGLGMGEWGEWGGWGMGDGGRGNGEWGMGNGAGAGVWAELERVKKGNGVYCR